MAISVGASSFKRQSVSLVKSIGGFLKSAFQPKKMSSKRSPIVPVIPNLTASSAEHWLSSTRIMKSVKTLPDGEWSKSRRGCVLARNPLLLLLCTAFFSWDENRITDDELNEISEEMSNIPANTSLEEKITCLEENLLDWERFVQQPNLVGWRKHANDSDLYEYKIFGSYDDVSAETFFKTQYDLEYRKSWDDTIDTLEIIDQEEQSQAQVIRWVMNFPFPLWSREYVYVRRSLIDEERNLMVLRCRHVDHPSCPVSAKNVRIQSYTSVTVIRPHSSFEQDGFDYIMSYCDDLQKTFPSAFYNWYTSTGVAKFLEKLHDAAKNLNSKTVLDEQIDYSNDEDEKEKPE